MNHNILQLKMFCLYRVGMKHWSWIEVGAHVFCRDSWVFFSCLDPYINADWGAGSRGKARSVVHSGSLGNMKTNEELAVNKRNYYQCGQERAPVLIPHSRKKKASKVEKEHSQERGWTFFIKLIQLSDCSYNTNGLPVRLYTSNLLRIVLCRSRTTVS